MAADMVIGAIAEGVADSVAKMVTWSHGRKILLTLLAFYQLEFMDYIISEV